jgi:hypothetical protein
MRNWLQEFSRTSKRPAGKINVEALKAVLHEFQSFLNISEQMTMVVYSFCLLRGKRHEVCVGELVEFLESELPQDETIRAVEYLVVMGFFMYGSEGPFSNYYDHIYLSHNAELALRTSDHTILPKEPKDDDDFVLMYIYARAVSLRNRSIVLSDWMYFTQSMMGWRDVPFIRYLKTAKLNKLHRAMALFTGILHLIDQHRVEPNTLIHLFSNTALEVARMKKELQDPLHPLYQKNLLERYKNEHGIVRIGAHDDWAALIHNNRDPKKRVAPVSQALQLYDHTTIHPKKLIYNPETEEQVRFLRKILVPSTLRKYESQAKKKGEPSGIIVLLSGGPGTGKTELARQIALETKRDLLFFNVAEQRNMYLGETEKAIKLVFDDYRRMHKQTNVAPILFFNEGDSVFSNRTQRASNISQTENSVQTILLQELEVFNGILIITTNRADSFDPAFQRRILINIPINEPGEPVRFALLQQFFPQLPEQEALQMSKRYSFTAAQLGVFVKQWELKALVKECKVSQTEALHTYLISIQGKAKTKIGFAV